MESAKSLGRIVGVLVFAHLAIGLTVPYILLQSLTRPPAAFLENAAEISLQVRLSVALLFLGGAVSVGIAVTVWPIVRQRSHAMGLWLLALAVANFTLQIVENAHWLGMLSLSQDYARADAVGSELFQALGVTVRSAWKWAHYTHLLVVVGWMFVLYALLLRLALIPRALAVLGLVTTILQITGITLPVLFGYRVPFRMELYGMPLGLAYLGLALWLMVNGFADRDSTESGDVL